MNREAILQGVAEVVRRHLGWKGSLTPDMRLVEDLHLDSVRLLTLAAEVENRFRVLLDEEEELRLVTVGDLLDVLAAKL